MMTSWKSRLLMVFTMLAVVLVITVPANAEDIDIDVECQADGGRCAKQVSHEVWHEDTDSEPQEDAFENPVAEGSDEECFPFCGDDVFGDRVDEVPNEDSADEGSDEECFPFCGYPWPY